MSEFSTLNGYKVKDKKAIRFYENVDAMKSDTTLKIGMHVKTQGYYTINDDGDAEYVIREITNNDVIDDAFIIELDNNLIAELINHNYNILKLGAKSDGETDCSDFINKMIEKYNNVYIPGGNFYISEKIELDGNNTDSFIFKCDATLNADINDYVIELTNTRLCKINIYKLINTNANGGGICLSDNTINNVIDIEYIEVNSPLACIGLINNDTKYITCNNFYGKLWINKSGNALYVENGVGTAITGFNTENNFNEINMQSWNDYTIYLNDLSTNSETQINFYGCNLETGYGIKSKGRVSYIGLFDCRVQEMLNKDNCIYIINNMPHIKITGHGIIYPHKLKFETITFWTGNTIYTNLDIHDYLKNKTYVGGGYIYYNYFVPFNVKKHNVYIDLTASDTDYTLQVNNNGGIGHIIITDAITTQNITIKIPNYLPEIMDNIIVQSYNIGHTVSILNQSNAGITYTTSAWGREMIILRGDKAINHYKLS